MTYAAVNEQTARLIAETPFPETTPPGVRLVESSDLHRVWRVQKFKYKGLAIICDVSIKRDGRLWYHVSFSRKDQIPSYEDRAWVKSWVVGDDRWAIELLPEKSKHVNTHPYCLHLWHCLEEDILPDFRTLGQI